MFTHELKKLYHESEFNFDNYGSNDIDEGESDLLWKDGNLGLYYVIRQVK
ncbi:MAG: hypothetical protein H7A23_09525 [Leptospiraceae bacterium]|nr:hypothetical protein [Leptospiraceae bacterium]MCP5494783.1 hypothetical protein [Leptospiraceae bacterium]